MTETETRCKPGTCVGEVSGRDSICVYCASEIQECQTLDQWGASCGEQLDTLGRCRVHDRPRRDRYNTAEPERY